MTKQLKEIEIPFGAKDSELKGWEYTIPEGMEAEIKNGKIIVREKESEDKRMKNFIYNELACLRAVDEKGSARYNELTEAIDWLEKQGEQKSEEVDNLHNYLYGEQKPADKVEPKFKVGDWIITNKNHIWYVDETPETTSYLYRLVNQYGKVEVAEFEIVDKKARLWTIQDAKDGDILATFNHVLIFKEFLKNDGGISYCHYDFGAGNPQFVWFEDKNWYFGKGTIIHPATKEQYDLLFEKMEKAGYMWDSKNKEVQKIEQKPTNNQFTPEQANVLDKHIDKYLEQKSAWSEEDEYLLGETIQRLEELMRIAKYCGIDVQPYQRDINWVKSLKDRVGCEANCTTTKEWSKEDERLFQIVIDILDRENHLGNISHTDLIACVRKLKSLRPQNKCAYNPYKEVVESIAEMCVHYANSSDLEDFYDNVVAKCKDAKEYDSLFPQNPWKPSDEQMEALLYEVNAWDKDSVNGQNLKSLYQDLKKLKA